MNTSARGAARILALTIAVAGFAAACSSSSTPAPATQAPATQAPASQAAAATDNGGGSISIPSFALPSFPSEAKDLEALLPASYCNVALTKASMAGADALGGNIDPTFAAALSALNKTPADVSVAFGTANGATDPKCTVNFFALRIAGADQSQLQQVYSAAATNNGDTVSTVNLGGKDVTKDVDPNGSNTYLIFKGDTAVGVTADSDDQAGPALAAIP